MGTRADHKDKADHNQRFLESIDQKTYSDWAVTVCFYKAVHVVEMLFAIDGKHSDNHRDRHDILKREHVDIWMEYLPLYAQSRRARYKVSHISPHTVKYVLGRLSKVEAIVAPLI